MSAIKLGHKHHTLNYPLHRVNKQITYLYIKKNTDTIDYSKDHTIFNYP